MEVRISVSSVDNEVEVAVTDNDCGIASEHVNRVFDRFYRADHSHSSVGAGLGLALVKSIAELHGGSAAIHSQTNIETQVPLRFQIPPRSLKIRSARMAPLKENVLFDLK